jgi:Tol biopolymer transport system component
MLDPLLHPGCGSWSPTGDWFACLGFTDEESREERHVPCGPPTAAACCASCTLCLRATFPGTNSPDGSRIVFLHSDPWPEACFECGPLFVVNTHGSGVRQITPPDLAQGAGSWSPDGRWILVGARHGKLYIIHQDGTELRRIPLDDAPGRSFAGVPSWSPDGTRILFGMSWKPNGYQPDLFTARRDGSDLEQVTDTAESEHTSDWGPSTG